MPVRAIIALSFMILSYAGYAQTCDCVFPWPSKCNTYCLKILLEEKSIGVVHRQLDIDRETLKKVKEFFDKNPDAEISSLDKVLKADQMQNLLEKLERSNSLKDSELKKIELEKNPTEKIPQELELKKGG